MDFPVSPEASSSSSLLPEREYHKRPGKYSSTQVATSNDSIHHSSQRGSSLSPTPFFSRQRGQRGQRFGPEFERRVDASFTQFFGHPPNQGAEQSSTQPSGERSPEDSPERSPQDSPEHSPEHSSFYSEPTVDAQAPVSPERDRLLSDDGRARGAFLESTDSFSRQTYESAAENGLSIPSDVLAELELNGETPIESYTFINGIQLGASPTAYPHYRKIREVLQGAPGGRERIALLESPSLPEDLTLLVTSSHPISRNVVVPFTNSWAHQSIVHFDPFHGHYTHDGKRISPMITCAHELEHAYQFLLVSRGDITQEYLSEKVDVFGGWEDRCELLAVQQENRLAEYLGQGVIRGYGNAGEQSWRFRARAFESNVPM